MRAKLPTGAVAVIVKDTGRMVAYSRDGSVFNWIHKHWRNKPLS